MEHRAMQEQLPGSDTYFFQAIMEMRHSVKVPSFT